jgi:ParB-like chromosome segregation protein Spo0J
MTKSTKEKTSLAELDIESWPIEKILPYEKNVKVHSEEQINKLVEIIKDRGFRRPITVDKDGVIIAGHGRKLAALRLGFTHLPVIVERHLSAEQIEADRISDNMIARGEFDESLLGELVMSLAKTKDFEMSLLGMDESEINTILEKYSFEELDEELERSLDELIAIEEYDKEEKAPEPKKSVEYKPYYSVVIECSGEPEQREVYEELKAQGKIVKIQTM